MRDKRLGPILLSGLIIGPILGSGIILLPPLIHETTGDYAILAWIVMMGIGFLFASLFGKLSIRYPNESGVAHAADQAFGRHIKQLTSVFFMIAGSLGPVAVLMTASQYMDAWFESVSWPAEGYGLILMVICLFILLRNVSSVGMVSFIFSSAAAVVLLSGGISALPYFREGDLVQTSFSFGDFGYSILLLFWALVGWEIIGNYSMDVKNRRKTIPQAIALSAIMITIVCVVVAAAVQWMDVNEVQQEGLILTTVLTPLFGTFASPLMALITTALCIGTYLLVTGGVARLIASESKRVKLLSILSYRSSTNVPIGALGLLTIVHAFVFLFLYAGLTNMEQLVALANAFFISNTICGMLAAYKLLPGRLTKGLSLGLTICFLVILSFSSLWILFSIGVLTVFYLIRHVRHKDSMASNMLIADRKETIIK